MADDDKKTDDDKKKKAARQQLEPNAEGNVVVDIIMGPYRDTRLTMTAADGQAAVDGHWAIAPNQAFDPDHEPHDPLSEQERNDALTAAHTWAKAQWDAAQGISPPPPEPPPESPPEGVAGKRAMKPEEGEAYKTRQQTPPPPQPKR
jgi:hypothetical protein